MFDRPRTSQAWTFLDLAPLIFMFNLLVDHLVVRGPLDIKPVIFAFNSLASESLPFLVHSLVAQHILSVQLSLLLLHVPFVYLFLALVL